MLKVYLKNIMYVFTSIIIGLFIFTLLNYFNIISDKFLNILKMILIIGIFIFSGFYLAKRSKGRGILEGLKIGGIISIFFFLVSILALPNSFELKNLIYYLILIISSMTGGIIAKQGKNINEKQNWIFSVLFSLKSSFAS